MSSQEHKRLNSFKGSEHHPWKKWGPYVAERAWGTVREDYSSDGNAWTYCSHDMARSKTYRWSEDGIGAICDRYQTYVFSWAFWNEKDPILKERLFGLNPFEGNHGEDVKEYYFYLDSTPTHSYMKYLYKYPQEEFPYEKLVKENQKRGGLDREYELIDTGIFQNHKYFDIFIEYAKKSPTDIAIQIEMCNRGNESAPIHFFPQLFFRNRWSWKSKFDSIPEIRKEPHQKGSIALLADPSRLPPIGGITYDYEKEPMFLYGEEGGESLFTYNETHCEKLFNTPSRTPYVKDAFHRYIIQKEQCLNPEEKGTKAAIHYKAIIPPQTSKKFCFRLTSERLDNPLEEVPILINKRKKEADEFYKEVLSPQASEEDKMIQRQALSGMLWGKQFYHFIVQKWLEGDTPLTPPPEGHKKVRNMHWRHLLAKDVISMPDKWEYPWFAAWDLAFHTVALAYVDLQYAQEQLQLLLQPQFQHPNGQIPAYEWSFSDLNPPTQAWAAWRLYELGGKKEVDFLEGCFLNLMRNFNWWVNKVDKEGNNFFEGGFLGLDNISVIDRSKPLPGGGTFEESDGTGWMGFFALMMFKMALELSKTKEVFEDLAIVYFKHFVYISHALQEPKGRAVRMWNEEEGFFYDTASYPSGQHVSLKIRSFVGIIPFFALDFYTEQELQKFPRFYNRFQVFIRERPDLCRMCILSQNKGYLFSLMTLHQIKKTFEKLWDKEEFLSDYGLRSLSKYHQESPFIFEGKKVSYEPGESTEKIKGGNSNWRGPIWIPTNFLVWHSLKRLQKAFGETVTIEGEPIQLKELAQKLKNSLLNLFRKTKDNKRPIYGECDLFQNDPHWRDLILFYEHYHGDNGRGLGASHQTGWSGLIATLIAEEPS